MNSNDPDNPLPFVQLAAITANVTRFLLSKRDQKAEHERKEEDRRASESGEAKAQRREFLVA